MLSSLLLKKDLKKLEELSIQQSVARAEATHQEGELRHQLIDRIGILPSLAISASFGCVAGWAANNKEVVAQINNLPIDDILQLIATYQSAAAQRPSVAEEVV